MVRWNAGTEHVAPPNKKRGTTSKWDLPSPAGFLSRCERSSKSGRIENHLATGTRNEKSQNFRTHLAGRRNPGLP
jgi:hypothetical protein